MNYKELLDDPALSAYFGKKKNKWIPEFQAIVDKSGISDCELGDKDAEKKLFSKTKFSWLGFFLNIYWSAYHGSLYWLHATVLWAILSSVNIFMFDTKLTTPLSFAFMFTYGMLGKSIMLASKAREFKETNSIALPSWGRVLVAILLGFTPAIIAFYTF